MNKRMPLRRKIPTFFWEHRGRVPPRVDSQAYRLEVGGAVAHPQRLSLVDLERLLPWVEVERRFYCVNGWSLERLWAGFRLADLLELVAPKPSAAYVRATSLGGYEDTSPIPLLVEGDALLVTHMEGEPLPPERGEPVRLMVFNLYQFKGVKALGKLEVVHQYRPGTWEQVGYDDPTVQPYPHLAIDLDEDRMPEPELLKGFERNLKKEAEHD